MMVNYDQLPDAVWSNIADFFGAEISGADRHALTRVAERDAKRKAAKVANVS